MLPDHLGIDMPEHFGYIFRPLTIAQLPHRKGMPELFRVRGLPFRLAVPVPSRDLPRVQRGAVATLKPHQYGALIDYGTV
jgi:hypothetical protein